MLSPLVSIIIPAYNRALELPQALDSVLTQSYTHWECLVVDDGSTDESDQVLKAYQGKDSRFRIFERDRLPKGAPTCRNIGLKHALGDYIIFLDSDDYLLPFCLEQRVRQLQHYPAHDVLVFPMGELKNGRLIKTEIPESDDYLVNFLSANLPWQTMCPLWKYDVITGLNGFTEGYPRFNDPELMIRALLQDDLKIMVFRDLDYDCVHIPSTKGTDTFADMVYTSLCLFVPHTVQLLETKGMTEYKVCLALYLHLWFKYIYVPFGDRNITSSLRLIHLFFKNGVISSSKYCSLIVRLFLYGFTYILFRKPIDKLTDKSFYMNKHEAVN
ncbi:glycosyltransferase involved in cell wall biosynthesis [Flavobacteriaceae bacterium MAR_2010_72]|nr:glycosyltransferase involved in cell wall biosynthesis [Flavobacteriaceae bacterium MAR_2010_72]